MLEPEFSVAHFLTMSHEYLKDERRSGVGYCVCAYSTSQRYQILKDLRLSVISSSLWDERVYLICAGTCC